ncbi:MAG: ATP-binding protein [Deltaproteobacteria bacterium]|nr:ATP-binding protein [Deltaproteobacteria bacterium]
MTQSLTLMLRQLRLPTFEECAQQIAIEAERSGWSFVQYLHHLTELELDSRRRNRVVRHLRASQLPADKTLATLKRETLPSGVQKKLPELCSRTLVDKAQNVLVFGLPGRGKTHLLSAIGYELIEQGCRILFVPAYKLVQRLLAAKESLRLEKELKKLDVFDAVILDDIVLCSRPTG